MSHDIPWNNIAYLRRKTAEDDDVTLDRAVIDEGTLREIAQRIASAPGLPLDRVRIDLLKRTEAPFSYEAEALQALLNAARMHA